MPIIGTKSDIVNFYNQQEQDMFGNRAWANARAAIDYGYQQASAQLQRQFGEQVAAAYNASLQQRSQVLGSNMGIGAQKQLLAGLDADVAQAYNSYLSTRYSDEQNLAAQTQTLQENIDTTISDLAESQLGLDEQLGAYYNFLTTNYADVLMNDKMFAKYLTDEVLVDAEGNPILDEEGNIQYVTDEEGNIKKRFKTLTELDEAVANEIVNEDGTISKEWQGFHDAQGNITLFGQDYYDLMLNYFGGHSGAPSFEDFLRKNYDEVDEKTQAKREAAYEFMKSYNPYTLNNLEDNTQLGSFKTMVGLTSTDNTYQFMERFGGWSKGEVRSLFSDFEDRLDKMTSWNNYDMKEQAQKNVNYIRDTMNDLAKVAADLGISEDELGFSWSNLDKILQEASLTSHTSAEMANEAFAAMGIGGVSGAGIASKVTVAGELLPGLGTAAHWISTAIGGVIGALAGLTSVVGTIDSQRTENKENVIWARDNYQRALELMINYSMAKHAELQKRFANN